MKTVLKRRKRTKLNRPQTLGSSGNARILESGEDRITEDGDTRILE